MNERRRGRRFYCTTVAAAAILLVAGCTDESRKSSPSRHPAKLGDHELAAEAVAAITYPPARRGDQVDNYHGRQVADPYRWLEETDSPETRAWIEAENQLTFDYLKAIPARAAIHDRLTRLWNYEKYGIPTQRGGRFFYSRNDGLQNQSVIYVAASLDAEPQVLLDPNALSADGTVALSGTAINDDGRLLAYGLATAGSDWQEWRVRDVETKQDLPDRLEWIKFSTASWSADGRGFFYSRYDEPDEQAALTGVNYFQKLFYHKLGSPQADDKLIYERADEKEWGFDGQVSDDGHWLVIRVWRGTDRRNQLFYLDLTNPEAQVLPWITGFDAQYDFIGNDGSTFWLRTDADAPRHRVIAADCTQSSRDGWQEIIPEREDVLQSVTLVGDRFIALYLEHAHSQVKLFDKTGQPQGEIPLAEIGTVARGRSEAERFAIVLFIHQLPYRSDDLSLRRGVGRNGDISSAQGQIRGPGVHHRTSVLREQGWHPRTDVHHAPQRRQAGRRESYIAVRLRRLRHFLDSVLLAGPVGMARAGRDIRAAQPSRWGRIRPGLA